MQNNIQKDGNAQMQDLQQLSLNICILHAIIVGRHLYNIVLRNQHGYNGILSFNKEKMDELGDLLS